MQFIFKGQLLKLVFFLGISAYLGYNNNLINLDLFVTLFLNIITI